MEGSLWIEIANDVDPPSNRATPKEIPPILSITDPLPVSTHVGGEVRFITKFGLHQSEAIATIDRDNSVTLSLTDDISVAEGRTPDSIDVYTDGSAKDNRAGWGIFIAGYDTSCRGCHGPVILNPSHNQYLGVKKASNNSAEMCAILWTLEWIKRVGLVGAIRIVVDSKPAMDEAEGRSHSAQYTITTRKIRDLLHELRQQRGISFHKVKGHSSNVGNDGADYQADLGRLGGNVFDTPERKFLDNQQTIDRTLLLSTMRN